MLELKRVESGYGETQVLYGMDLHAQPGRVLAVLGRNGAGKSTTLKTIMGLLPLQAGDMTLDGARLNGTPPYEVARAGIGYVPETRDIFPSLSVRENLDLAASRGRSGDWTMQTVTDLFPRLAERMDNGGQQLSGGEQQMLAIARILRTGAKTLLLDEPTEGLAPVIVQQIGHTIAALKDEGFTIVLVEQNFRFAASVADRHYVVDQGRVVDMIPNDQLEENAEKLHDYLGV